MNYFIDVCLALKFLLGLITFSKLNIKEDFILWERNFLHALMHSKNINLSCGVMIMHIYHFVFYYSWIYAHLPEGIYDD